MPKVHARVGETKALMQIAMDKGQRLSRPAPAHLEIFDRQVGSRVREGDVAVPAYMLAYHGLAA